MLDELLAYHDTPAEDDFTLRVAQAVRRRQRQRKVILWGAGAVGAAFGAAGTLMLSDAVAGVFAAGHGLTVSAGVVLAAGALAWLLQDEASTTG